jgi:phasin family protein
MKTVKHTHKGQSTMEKAYNEFATFNQENIDAFIRANAAVTRGFEQLSKNFVSLATRSLEDAVEASKRLSACKSISEAVELQTRLAQESIESFITEAKKVQELSATIVKDAAAPLTERFKATVANGAAAAQATANAAVATAQRATKQAA